MSFVSSSVQSVSNDILNNIQTKNTITGNIQETVSKIMRARNINKDTIFHIPDFDLSVQFPDNKDVYGNSLLECQIFHNKGNVILSKTDDDIRNAKQYSENKYVNLFLHTIRDADMYDLFGG